MAMHGPANAGRCSTHARQACFVHAPNINQIHLTCLGSDFTVATGFAGDQRSGETPDPIPNSEVKPGPPMILLRGKVGHCRRFQPRNRKVAGLSLFCVSALEVVGFPAISTDLEAMGGFFAMGARPWISVAGCLRWVESSRTYGEYASEGGS